MSALLRLVVFDVDGTLIDSQAHILGAMRSAFARSGLKEPAREAVLDVVGLSLPVAIRRLLPDLPASDAGPLEAHYRAEFSRRRVSSLAPLYPGARAALDELARRPGILMGIATGKSRRGLGHAIAEHDLAPFFTTTQVADNHPSKPHPSMLIAALHETGTEARNAVMVGDTRYDMEMARAAGMRGIGVAWGYHPAAQLRAAGAEIVVDDFAGLLPALDAMCEGV